MYGRTSNRWGTEEHQNLRVDYKKQFIILRNTNILFITFNIFIWHFQPKVQIVPYSTLYV